MTIWRVSDLAQPLKIQCRFKSGATTELEVLDIGEGGCMVDCKRWGAEPGARALVKLPGLSYQPAEIVWVEDERAGLAFETALHEAVLENLWQRYSVPA